jgi:hypothetical protein
MSSTNTINPKPCIMAGCNTRIYWNTLENAYFEVFSGNRHQCPNRQQGKKSNNTVTQRTTTKPNYYSKKSLYYTTQQNQQPKPKMSNSLELLQGPITDIQKKYEILSGIVSEANGKVHGSQSHIVTTANSISIIVYYEVSAEGQRDALKHKYSNYIQKVVDLQQ